MAKFDDVKFVYFDLDDTIWDFSTNSPISLKHVYKEFGFDRFAPTFDEFKGVYMPKNAELWQLYHHGKIEKEYLERERFRHVMVTIGAPRAEDQGFCDEVNAEYLRYLATLPTLIEGARQVLSDLQDRGVRMGILSNGFAGIQQQKLRSAGVLDYFSKVVLSDDVGFTKPMRGIYESAEAAVGLNGKDILMIGDNYEADVEGASRMGWHTIFFNRKKEYIECSCADAEVESLGQIVGLLG